MLAFIKREIVLIRQCWNYIDEYPALSSTVCNLDAFPQSCRLGWVKMIISIPSPMSLSFSRLPEYRRWCLREEVLWALPLALAGLSRKDQRGTLAYTNWDLRPCLLLPPQMPLSSPCPPAHFFVCLSLVTFHIDSKLRFYWNKTWMALTILCDARNETQGFKDVRWALHWVTWEPWWPSFGWLPDFAWLFSDPPSVGCYNHWNYRYSPPSTAGIIHFKVIKI